MKTDILDYYHKELDFLRKQGHSFAKEYPKVAARLQIDNESSKDPHVERLIQGIAFLNAGIRERLDEDFPQLCQSLMEVIYPHYLRPLPSYAIVSFEAESDMVDKSTITRGTELESSLVDEYTCKFVTVYDTDVLPLTINSASIKSLPVVAPKIPNMERIQSVLKLEFKPIASDVSLREIDAKKIRLYLKGNKHYVAELYDLLINHSEVLAVASMYSDPHLTTVDAKKCISQVGLDVSEGMLPYPNQSFIGYRLLTEYFAYPEKFMFIDIEVELSKLGEDADKIELYIYLNKAVRELESAVDKDYFVLGATPIINLFDHIAEPIKLDELQYEYPVISDSRNQSHIEIYSINSVTLSNQQGESSNVKPFFGVDHFQTDSLDSASSDFWHARRLYAEQSENYMHTKISIVSSDETYLARNDQVLVIGTKCFNNNLPAKLSKINSKTDMQFCEGSTSVKQIVLQSGFSDVRRPDLDDGIHWSLLAHLNLNYLSLTPNEEGSAAFRQILSLYAGKNENLLQIIKSLKIVSVEPTTKRLHSSSGFPFYARGKSITVCIDSEQSIGYSKILFLSVIERFLALYCSINSFVQMKAVDENSERIRCWPPRAGDQCQI